jgi:hypothetical protein
LEVSFREDAFAAIIRSTADPAKADKRTRSRGRGTKYLVNGSARISGDELVSAAEQISMPIKSPAITPPGIEPLSEASFSGDRAHDTVSRRSRPPINLRQGELGPSEPNGLKTGLPGRCKNASQRWSPRKPATTTITTTTPMM